jgi:hypothetical protein
VTKSSALCAKYYRQARRRWARHPWNVLYVIFYILFLWGGFLLLGSLLLREPSLKSSDEVTLFIGLVTGGVIWWQGHLIKKQMELSTIVDLYKEWNSEAMLRSRRAVWLNAEPNPDTIEEVLEFLEKVSTLEEMGFISRVLVWDTFGWYVSRYYFYCKDLIPRLRRKWTDPNTDFTLYRDLERFYEKLVKMELAERNCNGAIVTKLTKAELELELETTKRKFIISERQAADE